MILQVSDRRAVRRRWKIAYDRDEASSTSQTALIQDF